MTLPNQASRGCSARRLRRRRGAVGAFVIILYGSAWVDAKVLATLSPAVLFAALLGDSSCISERTGLPTRGPDRARRSSSASSLWGAFLAYQGTWLAPRAHYTELEDVDDEFAGEGPTLVTEVSGYGPRHFLSDLDPEGASDRRRRPVLLRQRQRADDRRSSGRSR